MIRLFFRSVLLVFLLVSCDKMKARKFAGTYRCTVDHYAWVLNQGVIADTAYAEDIEIKREGKHVVVMGRSIHVDSLRNEHAYKEGQYNNYFSVLFKKDSIYIEMMSGGLGGNSSWMYAGRKK